MKGINRYISPVLKIRHRDVMYSMMNIVNNIISQIVNNIVLQI